MNKEREKKAKEREKEEITEYDKMQPELKGVFDAISKYVEENDETLVTFIGSFVAFDEEKKVKDNTNRIFAYGNREVLLVQLNLLLEAVLDHKGKFVNWGAKIDKMKLKGISQEYKGGKK